MADDHESGKDNVTKLADERFRRQLDKRASKPTLRNLVMILEKDPAWRDVLAFDEFANVITKIQKPPYPGQPGPFLEFDAGETAVWLGEQFGMDVRSALALEAAEIVARRHPVHSVRQYLDSLRWDGAPRLERLLSDYCGADFNNYTARIGKMLMVSAVARVREPGCRVNFMLVLEGEQQISKSEFVRQLPGPQWFAEANESPAHKDFYQALQGRWIIEIAEMQSFSRAEVGKVKQAISAPADTYRPSYARYAKTFPRQCIFIGTTNDSEYLTDPTGAARFLPVRVTGVEIEAVRRDRDQLWAEAAALFRDGFRFWELPPEAKQEQDQRYRMDSWEEPIAEWLDGNGPPDAYTEPGPITRTTTTEVMSVALKLDVGKHTRPDQMRVGAILRRLGWVRQQEIGGDRRRFYVRQGAK